MTTTITFLAFVLVILVLAGGFLAPTVKDSHRIYTTAFIILLLIIVLLSNYKIWLWWFK